MTSRAGGNTRAAQGAGSKQLGACRLRRRVRGWPPAPGKPL